MKKTFQYDPESIRKRALKVPRSTTRIVTREEAIREHQKNKSGNEIGVLGDSIISTVSDKPGFGS